MCVRRTHIHSNRSMLRVYCYNLLCESTRDPTLTSHPHVNGQDRIIEFFLFQAMRQLMSIETNEEEKKRKKRIIGLNCYYRSFC